MSKETSERPYRVLDLEVLRAFVAVVRCGSFTAAGGQLSRTQSAVSMQVRRLEEQLGTTLLHRDRGRIRATAAGERVLGLAREMLSLNEQAFEARTPAAVSGRVRVGTIEHYARAVLPRVVAEFCRRYPAVSVEIQTGVSASMRDRLGLDFDLVLGISAAGAADGVILDRAPVVWATSKRHETERQRPLPLAVQLEGTLFRGWAISALEAAGIPWRVAYCSSSVAAVESAVDAGLAVAVFKRDTISNRLRVLGVKDGFPPLPQAEVWLSTGETQRSQAAALLYDFIIKTMHARAAMKRSSPRN